MNKHFDVYFGIGNKKLKQRKFKLKTKTMINSLKEWNSQNLQVINKSNVTNSPNTNDNFNLTKYYHRTVKRSNWSMCKA